MAAAHLVMGGPTPKKREVQPYGCKRKKVFESRRQANDVARLHKRQGKLFAYQCKCGYWHLTKHYHSD